LTQQGLCMSKTAIFFRLLGAEEKGEVLRTAVASVNGGSGGNLTYEADPASFRLIPGSPFAYWASEAVRRKFRELPPFEGEGRTVRVGLQTSDDFRFVRAWWEVSPERILYVPAKAEELDAPEALRRYQEACREATRRGQYWVPFAKGGEYSPYYADLHLVVNWRDDGMEIRNFDRAYIRNEDYYFRPGLTWPRRTNGLSFRVLPSGCIFADKGPAAFVSDNDPRVLNTLNAISNSQAFYAFVDVFLARVELAQSFEVGLIQKTPIPRLASSTQSESISLVMAAANMRKELDRVLEEKRVFIAPALCQVAGATLPERYFCWLKKASEAQREIDGIRRALDDWAFRIYGFTEDERAVITRALRSRAQEAQGMAAEAPEPEDVDDNDDRPLGQHEPLMSSEATLVANLLSYAVGCVFGRWDVRIGKGEKEPPPPPGPFDPLPPCPPGMLVGPDGLPARQTPPGYPIAIQWDGILVDDPGHPADIVARVREVLGYLFADGDPAAVEEEACAILGVRDLREWFRQEFFPFHIKMYSKKPRKAPIYWQLSSERKSYSVWLYYHCLNHDTLYTVLRSYVEPKIAYEEQKLREMQEQLGRSSMVARLVTQAKLPMETAEKLVSELGASGVLPPQYAVPGAHTGSKRDLERRIEAQERLLEELGRFRDRIRAVADMGHAPDLDDGVLLNIAPLHQVVPWKEAEKAWRELVAGKYPWAKISKVLCGPARR